jgi:hypothetical protein
VAGFSITLYDALGFFKAALEATTGLFDRYSVFPTFSCAKAILLPILQSVYF